MCVSLAAHRGHTVECSRAAWQVWDASVYCTFIKHRCPPMQDASTGVVGPSQAPTPPAHSCEYYSSWVGYLTQDLPVSPVLIPAFRQG